MDAYVPLANLWQPRRGNSENDDFVPVSINPYFYYPRYFDRGTMSDYLVDLESDEHVIKEVRRNILIFIARTFFVLIFILIPLSFLPAITSVITEAGGNGGVVTTTLYLVWFLLFWMVLFYRWTDYYLDVWVVTNRRIFDIEQNGLFSRNISVFRLERIEDVTVEVHGIVATFFKFGDLHVHTAGAHSTAEEHPSDLTIKSAHHPLEVKRIIMNAYSKSLKEISQDGIARVRHMEHPPEEA